MSLSMPRILTVARREFLTTVRRKAFLLTLIGTPLYFGAVTMLSSGTAVKEGKNALKEFTAMALVDSSGLFADADSSMRTEVKADDNPIARRNAMAQAMPAQAFRTQIRRFPDQASAEVALRAHQVAAIVVIPADYVATGKLWRYARSSNLFSEADSRAVNRWLATNLLRGRVDSTLAARVTRPAEREIFFTLDKSDRFVVQDKSRELANVFFPMFFSLLFGLCLTVGGQYLLQGISEEKESRILESLLCTVKPEELLAGKLLGLGSVGLLVVTIWVGTASLVAAPILAALHLSIPPAMVALGLAYFVLGYLFYGSMMIGIGGVTNNMREAQQFSVWFTFANFSPMIALWAILAHPNGPLAIGMSLFPPTAATTMLMRMAVPNTQVPPWQIALSLALLAGTSWLVLGAAARVFRIGMLLYGKTPNLPEILRWARQR